MVETRSTTFTHGGEPYESLASLNNCAGLWTAVLRSSGRIRASGAGFTPEEAVRVAVAALPVVAVGPPS